MPSWFKKRPLPSEEALGRASTHLKNTRHAKDQKRAQKLCDEALEALERMDISKSTKDLNQIAAVYQEHGRILETLGLGDQARLSYNKSEELMNKSVPTHSNIVFAANSSSSRSASTRSKETALSPIFTKDCKPPVIPYSLPNPDERLESTRQLAYCLALLKITALPPVSLDHNALAWLEVTKMNQDETDRLRTLATDLIRALARDELKDRMAIAEVMCLAPVLEKGDFRFLLSQFVNTINDSVLLDIHALEGLAHLIRSAAPGCMDADDLVNILELLSTRLQETFQQSPERIHQLTATVSHVLDAMADCNIQGLDRIMLHEPLLSYLGRLKADKDPYIVYQAAYAYQALLCVPDDEKRWQAALRRSGAVIKGVGGLASAIKELNITKFIDGLSTLQEGFQGASQIFELVQDAYNGVAALQESGQGLLESLKNDLSFSRKRAWYAALRGADFLIENGELRKFKILVYEAPCRLDLAFQWGICQRLGTLAANPMWDDDTRKDAITLLGEMYQNDGEWGQEPRIKQFILDIILELSRLPGHDAEEKTPLEAKNLLRNLAADGDENKQGHYLMCIQMGPKFLSDSTTLIDQVQNKPSVEPALRKYQRRRLQEQDRLHSVYIAPQAKATSNSPDEDLFDLTARVHEFITGDSDETVLLLLGDSGAGKSTFNLQLEKHLWKLYDTDKKWIPVFVALATISKPEKDLITKQLRRYGFKEDQIRELKSYRQFVLICDGYDEYQNMDNIYNDNRLNQPGEWSVKMVISCRSEFLGSDYRMLFQPGGHNDRRGATQLREAVIAPFSVPNISAYIRSYDSQRQSGEDAAWEVEDYERAIKHIPNLQDLVRNPFLLSLALEVLPRLVNLSEDFLSTRISRLTLYDVFVQQWIERGQKRLIERSLTGDDHIKFRILAADGFQRNAIGFVKNLAVAIFDKQDGKPMVEYSQSQDRTSWKEQFFGHSDGTHLLREACPLKRTDSQWGFIHRSVQEYAFARAVFEPWTPGEEPDEFMEQSDVRQGGNPSQIPSNAPLSSPLYRKSFVHESSIVSFLSEHVQQNDSFKAELQKFINESKIDDQFSQAAANAITVLVRAGVRFNDVNLRGIRVPGADLSFGNFDSAQLQGADLRRTILRNVWLHQADLSNSKMEGATFGEYPYLQVGSHVQYCVFSPDGKHLIVGLDNGTIDMYDTLTWNKELFQRHTSTVSNDVNLPNVRQITSGGEEESLHPWDGQTDDLAPSNDRAEKDISVAHSIDRCRNASDSWSQATPLWNAHSCALASSLRGHSGGVLSVVYSLNGLQIAAGSWDMTMRQWDAQAGAPISSLSGYTGKVISIAYSPDGLLIASGNLDKTVRLWDAQTGAFVSLLSGHIGSITAVEYSPDGKQIASGSADRTVRLWDPRTGDLTFSLSGHTKQVTAMAYSPICHQVASGSEDKSVRLWNTGTGTLAFSMKGHNDGVTSVAFSPNGQQIASGSKDQTVRLWDAKSGAFITSLNGHAESVTSVAFSPSGLQIASGSWDTTVRLWDAQRGTFSNLLSGHSNRVTSVAYSPSGSQIASGSYDETVRLWDAHTGAAASTLSGHTSSVTSVACSPCGQQIASGSCDKTVRLWDAETGALSLSLRGHEENVTSVAFSPSKGNHVASGSADHTVRLWNSKTGAFVFSLSRHTESVTSVAFSPSGHQIASGSEDETVRLWDAKSGVLISTLVGHSHWVTSVAYSPNGRQIASGSEDQTVLLWDAQTGAVEFSLRGHMHSVASVAYSPSGHQIASGSSDTTLKLWDAQTGSRVSSLRGHTDRITSLVYSPDGSQIASGSDDETVRLWDVTSGDCLAVLDGFQDVANGLTWKTAHDGTCLVVCGNSKSVRSWRVTTDEDQVRLCLQWRSTADTLVLSKASIQGVQGLSAMNIRLLQQRGALGLPIPP